MSFRSDSYLGVPGFTDAVETYENKFTWAQKGLGVLIGAQVSGAARDSGNTPTTVLRPGLLMGQVTASGLWKEYNPASTDGSQVAKGVLSVAMRMQNLDATNTNRFGWVVVAGPVKAAALLGLDNMARAQMAGRFLFDDDLANKFSFGGSLVEVAKTADYTVVAADAGTLFTTAGAAGAVVFTLPAIAAGLGPFEFLNLVDQNMTVASAAGDDVVAFNDAAADSLAFSTAGGKIGGRLRFQANAAGTKWYVQNMSAGANTITVAT